LVRCSYEGKVWAGEVGGRGVSEYRSIGVSEYRGVGVSEYRSNGL